MRRPEPLAIRAGVVTVLAAALHLAIVVGWLDFDADAEKAAVGVIDVLAGLAVVLWTRPKVTPLSAPKTADGRPLIPVPAVAPQQEVGRHVRLTNGEEGYGLVEALVAVVLVILIVWLLTRLF